MVDVQVLLYRLPRHRELHGLERRHSLFLDPRRHRHPVIDNIKHRTLEPRPPDVLAPQPLRDDRHCHRHHSGLRRPG